MEKCLDLNQRFQSLSSKNLQAFNTGLSLRWHKPTITTLNNLFNKLPLACTHKNTYLLLIVSQLTWPTEHANGSTVATRCDRIECRKANLASHHYRISWLPHDTDPNNFKSLVQCLQQSLSRCKSEVLVRWSVFHQRRNKDVHWESNLGRRTHVYVNDLKAYGG